MKNFPYELFHICAHYTFGQIYQNIRVISATYDPDLRRIMMHVYLDRVPTEYDTDSAREISCYIADEVNVNKYIDCIEDECIFSDEPYDQMEIEGHVIYARREYDLEDDNDEALHQLSWPSGLYGLCSSSTWGIKHDNINIISVTYNSELRHVKIHVYFNRDPTDDDRAIARHISCKLATAEDVSKYMDTVEAECIFCDKTHDQMNIEGEIISWDRKYIWGEDVCEPSPIEILPYELFHICVCATFGEIYRNIRIIEIIYNSTLKHIVVHICLDRVPTDYDMKAARIISGNIADDARISQYADKIEEKCIFSDEPYGSIKTYGRTIYERRQHDLENPQYDFENG